MKTCRHAFRAISIRSGLFPGEPWKSVRYLACGLQEGYVRCRSKGCVFYEEGTRANNSGLNEKRKEECDEKKVLNDHKEWIDSGGVDGKCSGRTTTK